MKHERQGNDLTTGNVTKQLFVFAIPMLLSNFLNALNNIVDRLWVGNLLGKEAVAAVGTSTPVIFIAIAVAFGLAIGANIVMSQYYGAKNFADIRKMVDTAFIVCVLAGVLFAVLGWFGIPYALHAIKSPPEVFGLSVGFLRISFVGIVFVFVSTMFTGFLRSLGDTVTPMLLLAASILINIILTPVLILGAGPFPEWGLNGAAVATVISQGAVIVFAYFYIYVKYPLLRIHFLKLRFSISMTNMLFKIGFPSIVQQSLISFGAVFVTRFVNHFGTAAVSALGAVNGIESIATMPALAVSGAVATMTGQAIGAKKLDRVKSIFKNALMFNAGITIAFSLPLFIFAPFFVSLFVKDAEVIAIGANYLHIVSPAYVFFALMVAANGVVNGSGHTIAVMALTLLSLWGIRVPLAALLMRTPLGLNGVWLSIAIGFFCGMLIVFVYFKSGKWKRRVIAPKPETPIEEITIEH